MKKITAILIALVLVLGLAACGNDSSDGTIVNVGSKDFTEQLILGQMTILVLEENGIRTADRTNVAGTDTCRQALASGDFSLYWEYTGTAWLMLLGADEALANAQETFDRVKAADAANGFVWLERAPMNNTYALVMPRALSSELGIRSISDLGRHITQNPGSLVLTCDHEFTARPDGLPGLVEMYGTDFGDNINILDMGLVYQTIQNGQAHVGMVFATDGRIKEYDLVVLQDDRTFFPVYNAAPVVREDILEEFPQIATILAPVARLLTDEVMQELNLRVDGSEAMEPREVAQEWLAANGFISG
jgi:osmoprotectant transport system substrate-binding protein